ncbi:TetR family transcriptional regulator [Sneathiella chungangensis]|uniref:TetR family transcriptional regulator n=1 Tax=Sneathiella chungangensis TaxID=1418234 RepID=A0A845MHW4_9PROT|nr:TetR/AcrR family transcriptional regulator [Sneathiella chungangensis]MZR23212.1 TetR family transcriptional regulator [Sneathiella chungangensis]
MTSYLFILQASPFLQVLFLSAVQFPQQKIYTEGDASGSNENMQQYIPFNKVLEKQTKDDGLKKGERTKLRLMIATAKLLQDTFFHDLRIVDICKESGVSQGTFYLYFEDKMDIATTTLSKFVHHIYQALKEAGKNRNSLSESAYFTTLAYVEQFHLNKGLLRCLMQMTEESTKFEEIYQTLNSNWNKRTAEAIARRTRKPLSENPEGLLVVYAAGGMVDEYLASLYVRRDPILVEHSGSPEDVAELLSKLWLRAVFGSRLGTEIQPASAGIPV